MSNRDFPSLSGLRIYLGKSSLIGTSPSWVQLAVSSAQLSQSVNRVIAGHCCPCYEVGAKYFVDGMRRRCPGNAKQVLKRGDRRDQTTIDNNINNNNTVSVCVRACVCFLKQVVWLSGNILSWIQLRDGSFVKQANKARQDYISVKAEVIIKWTSFNLLAG